MAACPAYTTLFVNGYQLSVIGCRSRIGVFGLMTACPAYTTLFVNGYQFSVFGCRLSVAHPTFAWEAWELCEPWGAMGSTGHSYSSQNSQGSQNSQNSQKTVCFLSVNPRARQRRRRKKLHKYTIAFNITRDSSFCIPRECKNL